MPRTQTRGVPDDSKRATEHHDLVIAARDKFGLDVALGAITGAWRGRRLTLDEQNRSAGKLRVRRVMQPHLETFVI